MHIGNNTETEDLTPGTSNGAHFAGMTSDGSQVYFTTEDALTADGDSSSTSTAPASTAAGR